MWLEVLHEFHPDTGTSSQKGDPLAVAGRRSLVTEDPITGCYGELRVSGSRVVWYEGLHPHNQTVRKVYSVETEILQTFWCVFSESASSSDGGSSGEVNSLRCVCVREHTCLTLFMQTGGVQCIPLPFLVNQAWPISSGLLLERQVSPEGGSDGLPILFTLLHPMDDFCPTTFRRPAATTADITVLGFFTDPQLRVVSTCVGHPAGPPLVICHDSSSGRHSVWAVQQATSEDIPTHLGTPRHPGSSMVTPQHPLSTSAPSRYSQLTPFAPLDTPVEMILSSRKYTPAPAHEMLKLPIIARLQKATPWNVPSSSVKRGEGGGGGGIGVRVGSGRSPFISRLQTPQSGMSHFAQKRSKSLSPQLLARISPFSQTINSRSWSTFYSEESFGDSFEPLVPQVCFRQLWCQEEEGTRHFPDLATSVFRTRDLMDAEYLALLIPSLAQLWLLQCRSTEEGSLTFGPLSSLPASQAIPVSKLDMILVLSPTAELQLYSGKTKITTIDVRSLTLSPSSPSPDAMEGSSPPVTLTGIRDPLGDSFTASLDSGRILRCSLPLLYRHPVVTLSLHALRHVLPTATALELLASYYTSSHQLPYPDLFPHFSQWLLACLSIPLPESEGMKAEDSESAWQGLQQSIDPQLLHSVPALQVFTSASATASSCPSSSPFSLEHTVSLQPHINTVVSTLHMVYEELKLNMLHHKPLNVMAQLLHRITSHLGWAPYVDHYQRDFPSLLLRHYPTAVKTTARLSEDSMEEHPSHLPPSPPHLLHWLYQKLRDKPVQPFPALPGVCKRTAQILKLYGLYKGGEGETVELSSLMEAVGGGEERLCAEQFTSLQAKTPSPHERVILCLVEEGVQLSDLETLPVGVCLPLWDCIVHCQEAPPSFWPPPAYDIVGRADVAKSVNMSCYTFPLKMENPEESDDGMNVDQETLRLRFPNDLRVNEVRRLLQSSRPVRIALTQKPEVSDHEFIEEQETHLLAVCQRTMALPVGRGMFSLSSTQPLPTAPLAIPNLNLSGRVPPRNAAVGLDHIEKPANMRQWVEFHNGVAAGLRIAPGISKLDSTWIIFNHPSEESSSNTYAGFLMALGLHGHLASLSDYHLYDYLQEKHELTVVGLLLGISAARAGSMSTSLVSLLTIYFPPLLPLGAADMEISHTMQTAAMMGVGLLYLASGNRHMVQVMLREIGHSPGPELEFAENRESYALSAGLALGLITLGLGGTLLGLSDLHLVDQLCLYMNGGPKTEVATPLPPAPSHLIQEGDQVNTHVTAPGAIVALGLMYIKTNDTAVAARLDAPGTQYELDCIRPDFLLLRALSRGLIMWDAIEPTQEWINSHIPQIVSKYAFQGSKAKEGYNPSIDYQTISLAYVNIVGGCCLAMGLCYAGTCDQKAYQCLLKNTRDLLSRIDSPAAEQAGKPCLENCLNTVMLALAVVMSGSGDLEVLRLVRQLRARVGHPEVHYGSHLATHMTLGLLFLGGGRYSLGRSNTAVAALVCALFPRFPNSSTDNRYHLQALRHLYIMAAEPRLLVTRDIRTSQACSVEVCVTAGGEQIHASTPCIIPEWSSIEKIEVYGDHYWPMNFDLSSNLCSKWRQALSKSGTIFVKSRMGQMSKSIAADTVLSSKSHGINNVKGMAKLTSRELSSDPVVKAFWDHIYKLDHESSSWAQLCSTVLLECISQEKLQVLTTYLQLEQTITQLPQFPSPSHLWQLKLARALVLCSQVPNHSNCQLLTRQCMDSLHMRAKSFMETAAKEWCTTNSLDELLRWYLLPGRTPAALSDREAALLALTLLLYDIPPPHLLQLTPQTTIPALYIKLNAMDISVATVVRLLPILQSPSTIDVL